MQIDWVVPYIKLPPIKNFSEFAWLQVTECRRANNTTQHPNAIPKHHSHYKNDCQTYTHTTYRYIHNVHWLIPDVLHRGIL